MGMGKYRYFLCEKDLIKPSELPDRWGLLYVNDKGKVRQKVGPKGNVWSMNQPYIFAERNIQNEMALMYSALRRLNLRGVLGLIYDKPWEKKHNKSINADVIRRTIRSGLPVYQAFKPLISVVRGMKL